MAQIPYNYFNQVNPSTNEWAVKVHVLRVWEVLDIKENRVKSIDFILMDGNVILFIENFNFQMNTKYNLYS